MRNTIRVVVKALFLLTLTLIECSVAYARSGSDLSNTQSDYPNTITEGLQTTRITISKSAQVLEKKSGEMSYSTIIDNMNVKVAFPSKEDYQKLIMAGDIQIDLTKIELIATLDQDGRSVSMMDVPLKQVIEQATTTICGNRVATAFLKIDGTQVALSFEKPERPASTGDPDGDPLEREQIARISWDVHDECDTFSIGGCGDGCSVLWDYGDHSVVSPGSCQACGDGWVSLCCCTPNHAAV